MEPKPRTPSKPAPGEAREPDEDKVRLGRQLLAEERTGVSASVSKDRCGMRLDRETQNRKKSLPQVAPTIEGEKKHQARHSRQTQQP